MLEDIRERLRSQLLLKISQQDTSMRNKIWGSIRGRFKRGTSDLDTVISNGQGHEPMMDIIHEINQPTRCGVVENGQTVLYIQQEEERRAQAEKVLEAKRTHDRQRNASGENIRYLRTLIREKYRLDLWVWSNRDVLEADQKIILKDCHKADAILNEIHTIVNRWEPDLFGPDEWRVAKKIRDSFTKGDRQVMWKDRPPWDPRHDERRESSETSWSQF